MCLCPGAEGRDTYPGGIAAPDPAREPPSSNTKELLNIKVSSKKCHQESHIMIMMIMMIEPGDHHRDDNDNDDNDDNDDRAW